MASSMTDSGDRRGGGGAKQKGKGLIDMDYSVVIAEGRGE